MNEITFSGKIPPKLRQWCEKHSHQVYDVSHGGGYSGGGGRYGDALYDVGLRRGWRKSDDAVHSVVGATLIEIMRELRSLEPCKCKDCISGENW